ncbi:MAG: hypothetical protein AB3N24_03885 [Leisingera sp.]
MIGEVIVHLGDTKTGSTSIQRALVQKAYEVPGSSILYPTGNHHIAMAKTLTQARRFKDRERRFRRVGEALRSSDADYGIVSAEHFQSVDPEVFAEAISAYWPGLQDRMRLVAYVRPHPDKLLSAFAERVKLGNALGSFENFTKTLSKNKAIDYLPRFSKWRQVFGDRFELRPFVRKELFREDAVADFFRFVLGHDDFRIAGGLSANTSLTVPQLALLREVHKVFSARLDELELKKNPEITEARNAMGRTTSERVRESGLGQDGEKALIPAHLAEQIQERYAEDAAALDAEFFDGTPMSDALAAIGSKTTGTAQPLKAARYFSDETVAGVRIFAGVMSEMLLNDPEQFRKLASGSRLMFMDGRGEARKEQTT